MNQVTAMFCGPWLKDGRYPNPGETGNQRDDRRMHAAVRATLRDPQSLIICGDGNDGEDLAYYEAFARTSGVQQVVRAFDPRQSTFADAQSAVREAIRILDLSRKGVIQIVTDWFHGDRAREYVEGELRRLLGPDHLVSVQLLQLYDGPEPTELMIQGEIKGADDYRTGRPYERLYAPLGKPAARGDTSNDELSS